MKDGRADALAFALGLGFGAFFLVGLGFVDVLRRNLVFTDFAGFWAGPRAFLLGADPYDPQTWQLTISQMGISRPESVYSYPPWTLFPLTPLAVLALPQATVVWTLGGLVLSALGTWKLMRTAATGFPLLHGLMGACLLGSHPAITSFYFAQWTSLLLGASALCIALLLRGHQRSAGLLAVVAIAKPQLFVFTALGLLRTAAALRWKTFALTAAAATAIPVCAAIIARPGWLMSWLTRIPGHLAPETPDAVTIPTAMSALVGGPGLWLGVAMIFIAIALVWSFEPREPASIAVWTALSSTAVVYGWSYDHLLLVIPIVIAAGCARRLSLVRGRILAIGGAALLLVGELGVYALRPDQNFNAFIPAALFLLIVTLLWPLRRGSAPLSPRRAVAAEVGPPPPRARSIDA